jgi:8-oxo-dGTP pyrophosphatase MutT (NUDIX family)
VLAANALVWNGDGGLLLVKTWNRDHLILPGGLVEEGESPADAARREVLEEVGLAVDVRALVAVQHLPADGSRPASVQLVFDTVPLTGVPSFVLQPSEIEVAHWLTTDRALVQHGGRGRNRLAAALEARRQSHAAYLDGDRRF